MNKIIGKALMGASYTTFSKGNERMWMNYFISEEIISSTEIKHGHRYAFDVVIIQYERAI